jgi:UDPglucose--hexose-1-phosphate uridylyltransferase
MFPAEVCAAGRIRRGEAVLFPNLVPYAKWSSVSVYSPSRHVLPLTELTPRLIADNIAAQLDFAQAVVAYDPSSAWASINANHLPPSGSSIFHPHLQGSANPVASTMQRLLAEAPVPEYVTAEREGERHIASGPCIDWIASFAPIGPAEIRGFVASPELDEAVDELAAGISRILHVYADLGYESFNLALTGTVLRIVARAYYGPLGRSDAMWSERLHWEAATDLTPESVAALARSRFA